MERVGHSWVEERPFDGGNQSDKVRYKKDNDRFNMNDPFIKVEFNRALQSCRDKSSPGIDNIEYRIKCLPEYLKLGLG